MPDAGIDGGDQQVIGAAGAGIKPGGGIGCCRAGRPRYVDDRLHSCYQRVRLSAMAELRLNELHCRAHGTPIGQAESMSSTLQSTGDGSSQHAGGTGKEDFHDPAVSPVLLNTGSSGGRSEWLQNLPINVGRHHVVHI